MPEGRWPRGAAVDSVVVSRGALEDPGCRRSCRSGIIPVASHCRTKIQGAGLGPHLGGGDRYI